MERGSENVIDKEFICLSCKWGRKDSENKAYCTKEGFECNGNQYRPTHFCEDYLRGDTK